MLDPAAPIDADGVILVADLVEKPSARAPSDYILIGRYVLTPDVFDEIEPCSPGSGSELQLTARCGRRPSGHRSTACSRVWRYDTGNPIGFLGARSRSPSAIRTWARRCVSCWRRSRKA